MSCRVCEVRIGSAEQRQMFEEVSERVQYVLKESLVPIGIDVLRERLRMIDLYIEGICGHTVVFWMREAGRIDPKMEVGISLPPSMLRNMLAEAGSPRRSVQDIVVHAYAKALEAHKNRSFKEAERWYDIADKGDAMQFSMLSLTECSQAGQV